MNMSILILDSVIRAVPRPQKISYQHEIERNIKTAFKLYSLENTIGSFAGQPKKQLE